MKSIYRTNYKEAIVSCVFCPGVRAYWVTEECDPLSKDAFTMHTVLHGEVICTPCRYSFEHCWLTSVSRDLLILAVNYEWCSADLASLYKKYLSGER